MQAMHIVSISFVFAGVNVSYQAIYQALDSGIQSLVISLLRQLVLILPVAGFFVGLVKGGSAEDYFIWWAFAITEVLTCIIGTIFLLRIKKNKIDKLS